MGRTTSLLGAGVATTFLFFLADSAVAQDWETKTFFLGAPDGHAMRLVVRTGEFHGDYTETRVTVRRDTVAGPQFFLLHRGMGTASAGSHRVVREEGSFVLHYGCGNRYFPVGQVCSERWTLGSPPELLATFTTSPWARAKRRVRRLLAQARWRAAYAVARRADTNPSGWADQSGELLRIFFQAAVRAGERAVGRRQRSEAVKRLIALVEQPPVTRLPGNPEDEWPTLNWCTNIERTDELVGTTGDVSPCPSHRRAGLNDDEGDKALLERGAALLERHGGTRARSAATSLRQASGDAG